MKKLLLSIILGIPPAILAVYCLSERAYLRPSGPEWLAVALFGAIYLLGSFAILTDKRPPQRGSEAHKRAMEARRQKHYESLPPGQL